MLSTITGEIIGESPAAKGIHEFVKAAARSSAPVLLLGESGTGKEQAARAMHFQSARRNSPFLMVDCSLYYERELERELFGYEPAPGEPPESARKGLLLFAPRGSCYAANVEELSPSIQMRLLNFLDTGYIQPVGSSRPVASKVRLIFSSEKNLEGLSSGGLFLEDLYRRFAAATALLPPLRERTEDLPALVSHFSHRIAAERGLSGPSLEWSAEAIDALRSYPWPGNVEELKREIERVVRVGPRSVTPDALSSSILGHWMGRRADPEVAAVVRELEECIREFRVMCRLDAQYGDILLDVEDWDVLFKSHQR